MAELSAKTPEPRIVPDVNTEANLVAPIVPEGWRVVWLPQHSVFLAYLDVDMPAGFDRPAVAEPDVDGVIAAIEALGHLRDLVREWVRTQKQNERAGSHG
ncbi:hypothetical protein [Halostreptopolyspora alba]|uniref:hypothetical protein n=1 Tax=Halostreptopolyspora alba TaxID=2487137 RepID=UPI0011CE3F85